MNVKILGAWRIVKEQGTKRNNTMSRQIYAKFSTNLEVSLLPVILP